MVKKDAGKNNDKKQTKDVFDPLVVESSHAGTVVLMLDSTEEEVVVKATLALYKFSEKCDVNKSLLLQLDTVPRALKLLASETSLIHRNACMLLGSMSRHSAVARTLKKLDIIPTLIKLLGPEEETVVIEYAALAMLSLAGYYSCKRVMCENKGIDALIRCLGSNDADVQKNSIDTLAILVQDDEAKQLVRDANGITPVCELMKSEYAVIQSQALVSLQLIAKDAANRQALRDSVAIVELLNIIANSSLGDIHCPSVHVIANLFEDFDTLQLMKDNGTLKKLLSLTSDIPPAVEDKKGKGKDNRAPSTKGKKGKGAAADDVSDDEENEEVDDGLVDDNSKVLEAATLFVPLAAEVKEQIALAFHRAAKSDASRKLLTEQELEKMLILLVNHCDQRVQIAASVAIRTMAEDFMSRDLLGKLGGISALVKMLTNESYHLQVAAVRALSKLTTSNEFNCREIAKYEGSQSLICMLDTEEEAVIDDLLTVLMNMGTDDQLSVELRSFSVIPALVKLLSFESEHVQCKVSSVLCLLAVNAQDRYEFVSSGGVTPLFDLLSSSNKDVKRCATALIASLAADDETSAVFCHRGALDVLRYMQTSCEANVYVDMAIHKLLFFNISSKYALTGRLDATDVIADGFYDVGRLKLGQPFMPIEWYCNEPVNSKRPVLYVSVQPRTDEQGDAGGEAVHCHDDRLSCMIDEVNKLLGPLQFASDAERAIALAQFVANQMGGPIDKGHFSAFSWELPISRIKYELRSNVIPIGRIEAGIHYHRALLFKVIGDRTGIPSALVRGEFNRAWNELELSEQSELDAVRFPPKTYIVDLIHEPGRLMKIDSAAAVVYRQL